MFLGPKVSFFWMSTICTRLDRDVQCAAEGVSPEQVGFQYESLKRQTSCLLLATTVHIIAEQTWALS